jgi:hypothetical protein
VSARWQDEEDRPPISIFWARPCFAGDSESYNPLWNLEEKLDRLVFKQRILFSFLKGKYVCFIQGMIFFSLE